MARWEYCKGAGCEEFWKSRQTPPRPEPVAGVPDEPRMGRAGMMVPKEKRSFSPPSEFWFLLGMALIYLALFGGIALTAWAGGFD
jgi:hypothetical protein